VVFRPWFMAVAVAWVLVAVPFLRAQSVKPTDYDVKAAYLYNFGHFVEWPANVAAAQNEFLHGLCFSARIPLARFLIPRLRVMKR